jgi:hypothetical protein
LEYLPKAREMQCAVCKKSFQTNTRCLNGHFVCDMCHASAGCESVAESGRASGSADPIAIATDMMLSPNVHMHGPEHHVLVGSALLTAYCNAGGKIDLEESLAEMSSRGSMVPGGFCGLAGTCGAAVSAGMFYSIITRTTPLSGGSWADANMLTSECLAAIASAGGPRCCKRDSYFAIITASEFVSEHLGVKMDTSEHPVCRFSSRNRECIGARCPFSPLHF